MAEQTMAPAKQENADVSRWSPFGRLGDLEQEIARLLREPWPFRSMWERGLPRLIGETTAWAPKIDVFEKNGDMVVKAELPGIRKEDIQITLEEGYLVLRGERKAESEVKEQDYYRSERSYGQFYRCVPIPSTVKPEQVKARFDDGVLEVRLPKPIVQVPQPTPIKIN
ncbi:MAG: Hsp20/alpha crystallin family protein [Chloroflexi bacterium]|nr:Hsp20/alpha crystallin family protein [Chloroflexota bacterium]